MSAPETRQDDLNVYRQDRNRFAPSLQKEKAS